MMGHSEFNDEKSGSFKTTDTGNRGTTYIDYLLPTGSAIAHYPYEQIKNR